MKNSIVSPFVTAYTSLNKDIIEKITLVNAQKSADSKCIRRSLQREEKLLLRQVNSQEKCVRSKEKDVNDTLNQLRIYIKEQCHVLTKLSLQLHVLQLKLNQTEALFKHITNLSKGFKDVEVYLTEVLSSSTVFKDQLTNLIDLKHVIEPLNDIYQQLALTGLSIQKLNTSL